MTNAHLVDGTYELFRAYFSAPKAQSKGAEVGACRGLAGSLLTLLKDPAVSHVACAFDHTITSFRNELFEGYKDGEGLEPEILCQFETAELVSHAFGLVTWPMVEFEADDALATGAVRYAGAADRIFLATPDKDLCQMVDSDKIVLWDRRRDIVLNDRGVEEKFGVLPTSIPDYLALTGDAADGIPGVPRWGAKSSSTMLAHYQRIEAIPRNVADWTVKPRGAKGLSESLEAHREQAALYRELATLRVDAPIAETFEELAWKGPNELALREVAERIGSKSLLGRVLALAESRL